MTNGGGTTLAVSTKDPEELPALGSNTQFHTSIIDVVIGGIVSVVVCIAVVLPMDVDISPSGRVIKAVVGQIISKDVV